MNREIVKTCPFCAHEFTRQEIMKSEDVTPKGMQFIDPGFRLNVYYFDHDCDGCGTTFTVPVMEFLPEIKEVIPKSVLTGSEWCEQRCVTMSDLEACSQECAFAPFRRFMLNELRIKSRAAATAPDG